MKWGSGGRYECREVGVELGTDMSNPVESLILVKVVFEEVKKGPSDVKIVVKIVVKIGSCQNICPE